MTRILILTDDQLFGKTLADTLNQLDELHPEVIQTHSSREARRNVREAHQPFDVFLVDQKLGSGKPYEDGITVLQELRALSPKTDSIIFQDVTSDPEQALRAYQAGAYRYVTKPIQGRELAWILRSLVEWRIDRFERSWLNELAAMAESAQTAISVSDVAEIVTRGGTSLGFQRARLWMLKDDSSVLEGISQRGDEGLSSFASFRMPIKTLPTELFEHRNPIFIESEDDHLGFFPPEFDAQGFIKPRGQWVRIPLWTAEQSLGVLALDYGAQPRKLDREQRNVLQKFGRQASAALQRARIYEQEQRLHQLGRQIADRAALVDLDQVLQDLYQEINTLLEAHNVMVVLRDDEENLFDFRLHIEHTIPQPRQRLSPETRYLVTDVITENKTLLLPKGGSAYRKERNIPSFMYQSRCWLGVPMQVQVHDQAVGKAVGALVVQDYEHEHVFTEKHRDLLESIAAQVAGSIQTAYLKDLREASRRQLEALHRTSEEIMKLADEREDWCLHATLTAATAQFGLRFSRAALFLFEDGQSQLRGRMGMGMLNAPDTSATSGAVKYETLEAYLADLRAEHVLPSTVNDVVCTLRINLHEDDSQPFRQVLDSGDRLLVAMEHASTVLPKHFFELFGQAEYALLPLRAGTRPLGLVVVDNKHSGIPLRSTSLNYMESLLAQTALILENIRQRRSRNLLIDRTHDIMSIATGERTLSDILQQICKVARDILHADCVVIYPLHPSDTPYEYDIPNIAAVGLNHDDQTIKVKPRQRGVATHILTTGTLVVHDTNENKMVATHRFIQRERIRAFIGCPMRTMLERRPYGVFYLNYRTPQTFTMQDIRQIESLAGLAAVVISNYRSTQGAQEQDLQVLSRVLGAALTTDQEEDVIRALIDGAHDLLRQPDVRVGVLLRQFIRVENFHDEARLVRKEYFLEGGRLVSSTEESLYRGISGRALQTGETQLVEDVRLHEHFDDDQIGTRSELDVPIKLGTIIIGAFNIEAPRVNAFSPQQRQSIERLASEAALALDNARRQGNLYTVLRAVEAVIAPTDLEETLNAIRDAVHSAAPSLSALSIWYQERADKAPQLVLQSGMRHDYTTDSTDTPPAVLYTMQSKQPIWARNVDQMPELTSTFVQQEEIFSLAAFPLQFGGQTVGAMFLNYRQEHAFTHEEKALFPILAEIAAASIQDAARDKAVKQERKRLRAALDISEAVGTTLNLDQILRKIMRVLHNLFPGASPCVLTYTPESNTLAFKEASLEFYRVDNPTYANLSPRMPVDEPGGGITSYLARKSLSSKQVEWYVTQGSAKNDPYYRDLILSTEAELCLTLMSGEHLLGVLMLESPEPDAFGPDDVALIQAVGQQISVALERSYNSEQLEFKNTMVALSAWGAEVSHDINREVGYIRNRVTWLGKEAHLSAEGRQYLGEIDRSADALAATLPRTDRTHKRAAPLVLNEWLEEHILAMVERQDVEVDVIVETDGNNQRVPTYPATLYRILRHLVRNALRAMDWEGTLFVRTVVDTQYFEVQLEDTGSGVPQHLIPFIFRQQIDPETEGGLGLLIVRALVESLGGRVTLQDPEPGRGATFILRLPIEQHTKPEE